MSAQQDSNKPQPILFELINPSDLYTFYASSIEVAGFCACRLSSAFGARALDGSEQRTPILFGWEEWLTERGIDQQWYDRHREEIADAFDSFLIGSANVREDVESMLSMLPEEKRDEWRAARQDRHRTSMNEIGEWAYAVAKGIRASLVEAK